MRAAPNTQLIRSRDDAAVAGVRLIVGRNIIDMALSIKLVDAARQHIVHELHECFSSVDESERHVVFHIDVDLVVRCDECLLALELGIH